jgi:hypothetical protein
MTYRFHVCGNVCLSQRRQVIRLSNNTLESGLEPFDGILLADLVRSTNWGLSSSSAGNAGTRSRPVLHLCIPSGLGVVISYMQA